jgi:protein-disulfide isomerase
MRRLFLIVPAALAVVAAGAWLVVEEAVPRASVAQHGAVEAAELEPFEQRVRDYLLNNPEVIMEALQILQERQRVAEEEELRQAIARRSEELLADPAAPVAGNPAGDVTLVEFFDYNCPYCRRVAPTVAGLVAADPDLRVVYKEFPILGPGSTFAARAALAAREQERYAPFHEAMMDAEGTLDERRVLEIARAVGLDLARLRDDMGDPAIEQAIARNLELAAALGITGTPSFVIGEQIIPGAVDRGTLEALIAEVRRSE